MEIVFRCLLIFLCIKVYTSPGISMSPLENRKYKILQKKSLKKLVSISNLLSIEPEKIRFPRARHNSLFCTLWSRKFGDFFFKLFLSHTTSLVMVYWVLLWYVVVVLRGTHIKERELPKRERGIEQAVFYCCRGDGKKREKEETFWADESEWVFIGVFLLQGKI